MAKAAAGTGTTEELVRSYFEAHARQDLDTVAGMWQPGGVGRIIGLTEWVAPEGLRDFFGEVYAAFPDWRFEVLETIAEDDRCTVRYRITATFAGAPFQGLEPTGARVSVEGCDVVEVRDGRVVRIDAYLDNADFARQAGALPPKDSPAEQRMTKLVNLRTRLAARICDPPEEIADGVWLVRGGMPIKGFNVYFVRDTHPGTGGDGVLMFDAGIKAMTNGLAAAGANLGGLTRVVLGHAHVDHRGAAPGMRGVPVYCHPADREDAEGDGGLRYQSDLSEISAPARWLYPKLLSSWDGGPVRIEGTIEEGDDVAGFEVVHVPGHAPGMIALWRASDRLALTTDTFYTANPERFVPISEPIVPHRAFNLDHEQARESVRKVAALDPASAWPGHAEPLTENVRERLERAADAG
jgi:glyoxylase-like metal-dependent hydrolase (beta-lactamase superfamily II)/predicted ester cyclase